MREKELRLALVCYGGVSLAVYMHGITKEIWHLARASRDYTTAMAASDRDCEGYHNLLGSIETLCGIKLRILPDIIAGASAGGINGIFLAQAIATGQSLEPLTALWLTNADVDRLLVPDPRPWFALTKFWAVPIAWLIAGRRGGSVKTTVSKQARGEVRAKLSRFVRAKWFAPPFGGALFTNSLLDAFDAMGAGQAGTRLLPHYQPLDLFVSVTDYAGYRQQIKLHSPPSITETEHRITMSFRDTANSRADFANTAELVFAARATASFPGAFPPFAVAELDRALAARERQWPERDMFLLRALPGHATAAEAAQTILIDGSVLANAPFQPAIEALRDRPARREVDRRFLYIDPTPNGRRTFGAAQKAGGAAPGFIATIFAALSDIPRQQPIRDSLDAVDARTSRIRRMQQIVDLLRPGVESAIEQLFGRTFFLNTPTPSRIEGWRKKAQMAAASQAGFAFEAYGHVKLSGIVDEITRLVVRQNPRLTVTEHDQLVKSLWVELRARGVARMRADSGIGASAAAISFFRAHDLNFRTRRLRSVIRTLAALIGEGRIVEQASEQLRETLFAMLARYLEREMIDFYDPLNHTSAGHLLDSIAAQQNLSLLDAETDTALAAGLALCPKAERRIVLFAYLGFPFYDISTLPMLQGEGLDEFDPIKVDRISPDDVTMLGSVTANPLKGTELNNFGAFFSRSYRENDYLWGRLHGADRLFDIIMSTVPGEIEPSVRDLTKRKLLISILDEEEPRLTHIADLFSAIRAEIAALPITA